METFQQGARASSGAQRVWVETTQHGARADSGRRESCQDREVGAVKCGLCLVPRAPDVPVGPTAGIGKG